MTHLRQELRLRQVGRLGALRAEYELLVHRRELALLDQQFGAGLLERGMLPGELQLPLIAAANFADQQDVEGSQQDTRGDAYADFQHGVGA